MAEGAAGQQNSVLIEKPAIHRITGIYIFTHRMVHEAQGSNHWHLAALNISFINYATNATEMVGMGMGDHHPRHRPGPQLFIDKAQGRPGCFLTGEGIKHDPTFIALDEGDIGQVEAPHLVDLARHHLIEAIGHVQQGLALEGGMNALEILALQQPVVAAHVPGHPAIVPQDLSVGRGGHKTPLGLLQIPLVGKGQAALLLLP